MSGPGELILKDSRSDNVLPEAEWLLTCIAADGTIAETPGDTKVRPYMSNYAAMGLARAYEITGNSVYLDPIWVWLAWYRDNMDPETGYINDYEGPSGARVDSGVADSTDAYAGTYLVALYLAWWAAPDGDAQLIPFYDSIPLALTAIESTQQSDGLTFALPTYDVKYLEDNIESLAGVRSAALLAALPAVVTAQPTLLARANATADAMSKGIGYMWNHDSNSWDYAIHSNRVYAHNDWTDENSQRQQVWATAWNALASEQQAQELMSVYSHAVPWDTQISSYEPIAAWAYRNAGDASSANAGSSHLETTADAHEHAYPYTCQISGIMLIGLYGFSEKMPSTHVLFPDGVNLIPDPQFLVDSNADGRADAITGTYGTPTTTLFALSSGDNYQSVNTPDGNGWAINWDPISVDENTYVTFSVFQRVTRIGSSGEVVLKYELYDADDTLVTYGYDVKNVISGPDFTRWYINAWIPPGVTHIKPVIGVTSATVLLAYPQVEVSGSPTAPPYGVPVI